MFEIAIFDTHGLNLSEQVLADPMRLLVYPHDLTVGGSQINAIDLAAAVSAAGHDVAVYGRPGPLVEYIERCGLEYIPARTMKYRPAPSRIAQLRAIAARRKLDLIHAYEWPSCLDAYYGSHLIGGVPLLCTVLSMDVMPIVPASIPLIMGTEELTQRARDMGQSKVWTLEPPIRTDWDTPSVDGSEFRSRYLTTGKDVVIVTVSRLAADLKLDALVRAMDAVEVLATRHPVKLVIVGDGPARESLLVRAQTINCRHGREVVSLHGEALDPRPCYSAADIVVGMGSSALRALSMERPVIVQGGDAFSLTFEPGTYDTFLHQGFYGLGDRQKGAHRLIAQLERLIDSSELRKQFGEFGRECVIERFSLERATLLQLKIYEEVLAAKTPFRLAEALKSIRLAAKIEIDNHRPSLFKARQSHIRRLFDAAGQGQWPPSEFVRD